MYKILVADDNDDIRDIIVFYIEEILSTAKFEVITAANGQEAVEKAKLNNFDLMILDVAMPGLSGIDAVRELRKLDGYKNTPMLAVTAYAMEKDKAQTLDAGFTDHLKKPVYLEDLKTILKKYLDF